MATAQAHFPGKYIFVWQTGRTCYEQKNGCITSVAVATEYVSPGSVDEVDAEALKYKCGGHLVINNAQFV